MADFILFVVSSIVLVSTLKLMSICFNRFDRYRENKSNYEKQSKNSSSTESK